MTCPVQDHHAFELQAIRSGDLSWHKCIIFSPNSGGKTLANDRKPVCTG
ncbi:MAG: hypothetical protein ACREPH_13965 [Rhodanobacteraceae bacterium]